ncbi:MAG: SLATT domain-containing protein [Pseudomonadota bacterium]
MKTEQRNLLESWGDELRLMMRTHYELSIKIRRMNYLLGVPLILLAILIAGYIFFTVTQDTGFWAKMTLGSLALLTAILASLQTFLKYSEKAENHRNASVRYQALFNMVEQQVAIPSKDDRTLAEWCDKLRERWDELNLEAPSVPRKLRTEPDIEIEPFIGEEPEPPIRAGKHEPKIEFGDRFEED